MPLHTFDEFDEIPNQTDRLVLTVEIPALSFPLSVPLIILY